MKIRKVVLKILDPDMYKIFKLFERFFKSSLTYSNHWGQRTKYAKYKCYQVDLYRKQ